VARIDSSAPLSLGEVAAALGQVRSGEELDEAVAMIGRLLHADEVTVSRVVAGRRCVETLTTHDGIEPGERYSFDDYPTTEHVIEDQVLGQLVVDDPAADEAERRLLADLGYAALLMAPVISRGTTVGLIEVSRRTGRPWTSGEIDQVRLLAQSLAGTLRVELDAAGLPWTADALGGRVAGR
jgi:GAF domain-containing protein